jgi:hypothetical protein
LQEELSLLSQQDLLRASPSDPTTLGIFVQKRVVSGIIPGGYPSLALSKTLAVGDVIEAVDGKPVTDETLLTHIKNTRDAVGSRVKLLVTNRAGSRREIVLIRQLNSRLTPTAKVVAALADMGQAATTPAAQEALSALSTEIAGLLASFTEEDAALCERLFALQRKAAAQARASTAAPSPPAKESNDANALLKGELDAATQRAIKAEGALAAATQRATKAEVAAREWEEAVELLNRQVCLCGVGFAREGRKQVDTTGEKG